MPVQCDTCDSERLSRSDLGEHLGSGGNKDVFAYGESQAVGILKQGRSPSTLIKELSLLNQLDELGLPTVNAAGPIKVGDSLALLFDRFAQGSKTIVRKNPKKLGILPDADTSLLNDRSISDLKFIRRTLIEKNVKIDDLQFLIGSDGRVVIADPLDVFEDTSPSPTNLRTIDKLIEAASKR